MWAGEGYPSFLPTCTVVSTFIFMQYKTLTVNTTHESFDLRHGSGDGYQIHWDRINTPVKLISWIQHLMDKTWVTPQHIYDLVDAVKVKFGDWQIDC